MVIRASASELDVSGSPAELRIIANALSYVVAGASLRFEAEMGIDPSPYDKLLAAFEVRATGGLVRVSVAGGSLIATGSPEALNVFASFFNFNDDTPRGYHVHHEWHTESDPIEVDSRPLVISVA